MRSRSSSRSPLHVTPPRRRPHERMAATLSAAVAPAARAWAAAVCLAAALAWSAPAAVADTCPGASQCPYAAAQVIGVRAEGVLRFPEAVAVGPQGDVYVADQLSYVVQKFTAAGAFETEWGSYGGGARAVRPDRRARDRRAAATSTSSTRATTGSRSSTPAATSSPPGAAAARTRRVPRSAPPRPRPSRPAAASRSAGSYVYVADTGNDRIERFNLDGGEPIAVGLARGRARRSSPIRAASPRTPARCWSPTTTTTASSSSDPNGDFVGARRAPTAPGRGSSAFPYGVALDAAGNVYVADDNNHRDRQAEPAAGVPRRLGQLRRGARAVRRSRARSPAIPPATRTWRTQPTSRVEVFDPERRAPARRSAPPPAAPAMLTAPRGLAVDPSGRAVRLRHRRQPRRGVLAGQRRLAGDWQSAARGRRTPTLSFAVPRGIAIDPRGLGVRRRHRQRAGRAPVGRRHVPRRNRRPGRLGGAQLAAPARWRSRGSGDLYVADTDPQPRPGLRAEGALLAKWGAGGGDGAGRQRAGRVQPPDAVAVDVAGRRVRRRQRQRPHRRASPDGAPDAVGRRAADATGAFARRPAWRSTRSVACTSSTTATTACRCSTRAGGSSRNGACAARCSASSHSRPQSPSTAPARCTSPTPTTIAYERFTPLSPGPNSCAAPGSWPPPLNVAPKLNVALPRRAGVLARRGVALTVSCDRGCRVLITATVATRKPYRTFGLVAVARPLPARRTGHVRLRIAPTALARLRKALGHHVGMVAKVTIVAAGPSGRRTTLHRSYSVTR